MPTANESPANFYAITHEEFEEKLVAMIEEVKCELAAEKEKLFTAGHLECPAVNNYQRRIITSASEVLCHEHWREVDCIQQNQDSQDNRGNLDSQGSQDNLGMASHKNGKFYFHIWFPNSHLL